MLQRDAAIKGCILLVCPTIQCLCL